MTKRALIVAASALIVMAVVAVVSVRFLGSEDEKAVAGGYCAHLPDSIGLYPGNPVTQMGVEVGRVTELRPEGDVVRVTFELSGERSYPADVSVVTRSKSLLADRSLELVGNHADGPTLRPEECVARDRAHTPLSISEVSGSTADFVDHLVTDGSTSVADTLSGLAGAMEGTDPDTHSMFTRLSAASRNPDRVISDMGASIEAMAPFTQEALSEWERIGSIVEQLPEATANLAEVTPNVARFDRGVGWLVALLYDIHVRYGEDLWPALHGSAHGIRHGAENIGQALDFLELIPGLETTLHQQAQSSGGLSVPYEAPATLGADGVATIPDLVTEEMGR